MAIHFHTPSAQTLNNPKDNNHWRNQDADEFLKEKDLPVPGKDVPVQWVQVKLASNIKVAFYVWGDHIFYCGMDQTEEAYRYANHQFRWWFRNATTDEELSDIPIKVEPVGDAYQSDPIVCFDPNERRGGYREVRDEAIPYAFLRIKVSLDDAVLGEFVSHFHQPQTGKVEIVPGTNDVEFTSEFFGLQRKWRRTLQYTSHSTPIKMNHWERTQRFNTSSTNPIRTILLALSGEQCDADALWDRFFAINGIGGLFKKVDDAGIASILKRKAYKANIERLQTEAPLEWDFFRWLMNGKTKEKQRNNTLLSAFVQAVGEDYDALLSGIQAARRGMRFGKTDSELFSDYREHNDMPNLWFQAKRDVCLSLPGASDKVQEQEAKADFRKRKGFGSQADGLGVTKDNFPKLRKAIEAGDIPISVFNQPGKDGQPVNREFGLWEKALKRKGWAEVICEIARTATERKNYERDITPFLNFLFRIEVYLKRHTKKKWTAMPRFVKSQFELEMDDESDTGTVKKRSAFTPVADNETNTITVPYVAMSVSGVRTQWCYARHYYIFEEGFTDPESEGIVVDELEKGLNGRDDYGLCYYTLTGTVTARGYPTFLIIFERLEERLVRGPKDPDCPACFPEKHGVTDNRGDIAKKGCAYHFPKTEGGTRVHFHRVRPQRSKNGVQTPACTLIQACYQYMAGNIPASDITAQQGDLIFIRHPNDPIAAKAKVEDPREGNGMEFESHRFVPLVENGALMRLFVSKAKTPKNRLGFLHAPNGLAVKHPEHDDIDRLEEGWWEIRRCKSWEANPQAIWSLTID